MLTILNIENVKKNKISGISSGKMMENGKIFIAGEFDENDNIEIKNISPSDWKKVKLELKENGIDSRDLNFKSLSSNNLIKKENCLDAFKAVEWL